MGWKRGAFVVASVAVTAATLLSQGHSAAAQKPDGDGQTIFRFDTFGDEQFWTDVLRMHEAVRTVDPETALGVGLKVDVEALPAPLIAALQAGQVNLKDPAVTIELLRLNAVVGLVGRVNNAGELTSIGTTCALCHSTVDNSFAPGIGKRLDGWPNRDLNVGVIVGLSPVIDDTAFSSWGPGSTTRGITRSMARTSSR